ncbi:MAG: methyltransferase domain-containing protein [Sulfuricurvum sp.]
MFIPDVGRDNEKNRNEWLRITLAQLPDGSRILDAGAGELKNRQFCTHLEYVSQDFCEYNGKGDEHALQTGKWDTSKVDIVSDIINIPVDDCEFDYVICTEVLEHLPEPILALRELTRVLKEGGVR